MRVRWTTPAREQVVNAYEYIAEENRNAAAQLIGQIEDTSEILSSYPNAGRPGRVAGTRELVVPGTPFIIAYKVERSEVRVLAVLHGARKWPDEF